MKRLVLITALLAFALSCSAAKPDNQSIAQTEKELRQLERNLITAVQRKDGEALSRIWAEEYLGTAPDGNVVTKSDLMAAVKNGAIQIEAFEIDDQRVRVFGDFAVITGHALVKGRVYGEDYSGSYRGTGVYIKRGGRWEVIGVHVGPDKKCAS
jgi:ketosteroid isomerase-like protein